MARYYFHLHNGTFIPDPDGMELSNWQSASAHAMARAGEVVAERGAKFWNGEHLRIVVTDGIGTALFELRLSGHLPVELNVLSPEEPGRIN